MINIRGNHKELLIKGNYNRLTGGATKNKGNCIFFEEKDWSLINFDPTDGDKKHQLTS